MNLKKIFRNVKDTVCNEVQPRIFLRFPLSSAKITLTHGFACGFHWKILETCGFFTAVY